MKAKLLVIFAVALSPVVWQVGKAANQIKACDLLTKQEVENIIGEKIDSVEVQAEYGNCLYHKKENFFGKVMMIPVVTVGYTRADVKARWDAWASKPKSEVVTGVGDAAIWSPDFGFLVSRIKDGLLMISVGGGVKKDVAVRLAKKAVERIKP